MCFYRVFGQNSQYVLLILEAFVELAMKLNVLPNNFRAT